MSLGLFPNLNTRSISENVDTCKYRDNKHDARHVTYIFRNSFLSSCFSSALKAYDHTFTFSQCFLCDSNYCRHLSGDTQVSKEALHFRTEKKEVTEMYVSYNIIKTLFA